MCGRFVGSYRVDDLLAELEEAVVSSGLTLEMPATELPLLENFNVAPTQPVPVLVRQDASIHLEVMQWGLVPNWSKDPKIGSKMINARAETLTEKVSFKGLVSSHRCVIPMSGFYEWKRPSGQPKIPYYVTREDGHLMLVAGLWTRNLLVDNEFTFAMITRDSGDDLVSVHDRAPAHLSSVDACDWLIGDVSSEFLLNISAQPRLKYHQVSTEVNSVRNNHRSLINEVSVSRIDIGGADIDVQDHPRLF